MARNAITVKDAFLIFTADELLDELFGATYFSSQILLHYEDRHKITFRKHHAYYKWLVMPFSLSNA